MTPDPFSLGPYATVIGVLLLGAGCYLWGSYGGVSMKAAKRLEADGYNRGWCEGHANGSYYGRKDGWLAAHRLALTALRATPFSQPLKKLVTALAAGEQPHRAITDISTTTNATLGTVTLTGDGPE